MDTLLQNVRLGLRSLRRTPGFTAVAVLTLALGIGLATAVFTVAEALLLRRLPVAGQERLVVLWSEMRDRRVDHYPLGLEGAQEFARRTRTLQQVAWHGYEGAAPRALREGERMSRIQRSLVSGGFFDVLGARPLLGRALQPSDDVPGAAPVVVLSHGAWERKFGGDPRVLGRQLLLHEDGVAYTVVGVMPQGVDYPRGTEAWAAIAPSIPAANLQFAAVDLVGRLAPGATAAAARDELTAYHQRPEAPPPLRSLTGVVTPLPELVLGDVRPALLVFAAASALLLLITCINVANLLLVRGLARVREVAVRSALGASRRAVVAQLLTENALLAVTGGVVGVLVAAAAVRGFVAVAPAGLPRLDEIGLNLAALGGAVGITVAALLVFAVAPAVTTSRVELQAALRSGTRQSGSRRSRLVSELLVAGQVALALVVLSAAGLIARSLVALERAELAYDPSRLLVAELALRQEQYGDAAAQRAMLEALQPALEAVPGVRDVTPVVAVPFSGTHGWDGRPAAEGQTPEQASANPMLNMELVEPGYFGMFGIPVRQGRTFTDADRQGALPVVVLSESAANAYWPGERAVGRRLTMGPQVLTVVGVVPDTRYRDLREARPSIYFPLRQSFFPFAPTSLAIRTEGEPAALVPALRRAIEAAAPGVALASAAPFEQFLERPLAQPRLNALLLLVFATAAVVLAAVGLFGVMATMVRQRTRELGVRAALGATAGDLRRLVMRRGLVIAAAGAALGLVGAVAANRLLVAMLYEVSPTDLTTLAAVTAVLLVVAALASVLPARSGARVDPAVALRSEA